MKTLSCILLLCSLFVYAKEDELPSDSLILLSIFNEVDSSGNFYKMENPEYMGQSWVQENISFYVLYKYWIEVNHQKKLFVSTSAYTNSLHGHQMGIKNNYYLLQSEEGLEVDMQPEEDSYSVVGEISDSIIQIGMNKKALVSYYFSDGNRHFESGITIYLFEEDKLTPVFRTDLLYDNAHRIDGLRFGECMFSTWKAKYSILNNNQEYFDIQLTKSTSSYDPKTCEDLNQPTSTSTVYKWNGEKYILQHE